MYKKVELRWDVKGRHIILTPWVQENEFSGRFIYVYMYLFIFFFYNI